MQYETSDATSGSDSDTSFSTPSQGPQPLDMDPDEAISAVVEDEVSAFCSNLEHKFAQAMVSMKVQPVGAEAAAWESATARHLVHQVQQALAEADADVEHSLLGGTPEAAVKLRELEVQIVQKAARNAQAEKERQERISTEFAALKAADAAESSTKSNLQGFDHIAFERADTGRRVFKTRWLFTAMRLVLTGRILTTGFDSSNSAMRLSRTSSRASSRH